MRTLLQFSVVRTSINGCCCAVFAGQTKARLEEMPNERKFEFSEMNIFAKFNTFVKRLKKIIEMFETMEMYSHLTDSKIEGEPAASCSVTSHHSHGVHVSHFCRHVKCDLILCVVCHWAPFVSLDRIAHI